MSAEFETLLQQIEQGEAVASSDLLPYLCAEECGQRAQINSQLAKAYWKSGRAENREQAKTFIQRAWLLSRFSVDLLPLYIEICLGLNDIESIREAYKRLGMQQAAQGNIGGAINYFDQWHYTDAVYCRLDKYEYDLDILDCMERLAEPYRLNPKLRMDCLTNGKIRVAYLVKGIRELGSILVKINLLYARYHDRSLFEPIFFVPESQEDVISVEQGRAHLESFKQLGFQVVMGPNETNWTRRMLTVVRSIYEAHPDLLVTGGALSFFEHFFIQACRPAPVTIGLVQGPPPQFAPLTLDWGIAWTKHPLIDCPVGCSLVSMEFDLPNRDEIQPYERTDYSIPANACVVVSAGRNVKFQDIEFWQAILDLLSRYSHLYFLALGVTEEQIPFLPTIVPSIFMSRIRFFDWRGDEYLKALCLADILLDTFPSGGGGILTDAMALRIPIVAFENNYLRSFDQTDWSLAEEILDLPEIVVQRRNWSQMKSVMARLIDDLEYRTYVGQRCFEHVHRTRSTPARTVRKSEDIYRRVLSHKLTEPDNSNSYGIRIHRSATPSNYPVRWNSLRARIRRQIAPIVRFGKQVYRRLYEEKLI